MSATLTGRSLGRYEVREVVGSGLFGTLYRAWDPEPGVERALKVLDRLGSSAGERRLRLYQEIGDAAQVRHPGIVRVYDVFEAEGLLCVLMDLVPGRSLAERLRGRPLSGAETARIGTEVAEALDAALRRGVLHGDLKPSNVLLSEPHGAVLVTDFGLVPDAHQVSAPRSGTAAGSAPYWAPEMLAPEPAIDWRVDVYALAAVVYRMATGRPPAPRGGVLGPGPHRPPVPPSDLNPALPPGVDEILARGLSADPSRRPDWPGALARDVAAALVERRVEAARPPVVLPWVPVGPLPVEDRGAGAARARSPQRPRRPREPAVAEPASPAVPAAPVVPAAATPARQAPAWWAPQRATGTPAGAGPAPGAASARPSARAAAAPAPPLPPAPVAAPGPPAAPAPAPARPAAPAPPAPPGPAEAAPPAPAAAPGPPAAAVSAAPVPAPPPAAARSGPRRRGRRRRRLAGAVLVVLLGLAGAGVAGRATGPGAAALGSAAGLVSGVRLPGAPPPDTWPAGVTAAMVGRAVAVRLLACTGADAALAQMTCPQEGDRHGEPVERWTLAGDPTLGAVVRYLGRQQFGVNGRFVMVLQGRDRAYFPQVDAAAYDAHVLWIGARLEVLRVARVLKGPPVPRPAAATDGLALAAARAAFDACAQPAQAPTADGCPSSPLPECGREAVQSKLSWNQNASAMVTYDSARGIAHVAGRYGMDQTATSATPGCPAVQSTRTWGAYDLWMVWESDHFAVVDAVYRQAGPG